MAQGDDGGRSAGRHSLKEGGGHCVGSVPQGDPRRLYHVADNGFDPEGRWGILPEYWPCGDIVEDRDRRPEPTLHLVDMLTWRTSWVLGRPQEGYCCP